MNIALRRKLIVIFPALFALFASLAAGSDAEVCPRPIGGSTITPPAEVRASGGQLHVALAFWSQVDDFGLTRYCYITGNNLEAPTLRARPGDEIVLDVKNELTPHPANALAEHRHAANSCTTGTVTAVSTNVHFHGLEIPPTCHQDDVIHTSIQPSEPAFQYRFRIPADQPPGLYWYHPHPHGFSEPQVLGGASGALIVRGDRGLKATSGRSARTDSHSEGSGDTGAAKFFGRFGRCRRKRYLFELRAGDVSALHACRPESAAGSRGVLARLEMRS